MASIREKIKDSKIISFQFTCSLGRDEHDKQIRRYGSWTPPDGLSAAKARKAAAKAAEAWEKEVRAEYEQDIKDPERVKAREIARSRTEFVSFVLEDWFPVCIDNGEHKPKTIAFYNDTTKNIVDYFKGCVIQKINPTDIQKFIIFLRTAKGYTPKYMHHHYRTISNM